MSQLTSYIYDDAYVCEEAAQNQRATDYTFETRGIVDSAMSCTPWSAPVQTTGQGAVVPVPMVTVDSMFRGMHVGGADGVTAGDSAYARDGVLTHLDDIVSAPESVPYCDLRGPTSTRDEPSPVEIPSRVVDLGIPPPHPWERRVSGNINSRELSRQVYETMHPTPDCA
jgi:hypothetical protein